MIILKLLYYAGMGISGFISIFYLLASVYGLTQDMDVNRRREDLVMIVAACVTIGLLYWAFRLGHQQQHWGSGLKMIAIAVGAFLLIFIVGVLTFVKLRWQ